VPFLYRRKRVSVEMHRKRERYLVLHTSYSSAKIVPSPSYLRSETKKRGAKTMRNELARKARKDLRRMRRYFRDRVWRALLKEWLRGWEFARTLYAYHGLH